MPDEIDILDTPSTIDRREAIRRVSAMLGGAAFIGGTSLLAACSKEPAAKATDTAVAKSTTPEMKQTMFTADQVALLEEVGETILPETKTPGAKAAKCGLFMAMMVQDCYEPKDQEIFKKGLTDLDAASQAASKVAFMQATPEQRLSLLTQLDKDAKAYQESKKKDDPNHYFRMMKELTLLGYFTSEVGMTKAMRYFETPGRLDPCAPYVKGETIFANHA